MNLVLVVLSLPLGYLIYLIFRDVFERLFSAGYKAALALPGPKIYPVFGNLIEIASLDRGV
jgi:hypothetical protein